MKRTIYIFIGLYIFSQAKAQSNNEQVTLDFCIESALSNNPLIKESRNTAAISSIDVLSARSALYPVISSEASGGFSNEYRSGNEYKTGFAGITASQLLWQKGSANSNIEKSVYSEKAAKALYDAARQDIVYNVKIAYYNSVLQFKLYNISQADVARTELFLQYAKELYRIGSGKKSDVLKAESDLAEAQYRSESYLNSAKQQLNELAMLTGIPYDGLTTLDDTLPDNSFVYNADSIYTLALQRYPELQAINNIKLSQLSAIKAAEADHFPQLYINSGYNLNYNPTFSEQDNWYTLLTLRWDIFNGNEKRYRLQTEKIKSEIFENRIEETKNFLIKEVNSRLISLNEAEKQIELTNSLIKTTAENLEIAKAQYVAGTGSLLELTDVRIANLAAQQQNIRAKTTYLTAIANLERLTENINEF